MIDLLNPGAKRSNLAVRWNKRSRAFVVDNLFSIECGELDDLLAVLEVIHYHTIFDSRNLKISIFRKALRTELLEHII